MKKKLLALSVLSAFATVPSVAQNLTVYGLIDGGYAMLKGTNGSDTTNQNFVGGIQSGNGSGNLSGSRLGFKASEDLGGGMKIEVVLENGVNFSNPSGGTATDNKTAASATAGVNSNGQSILSGNTRASFVDLKTASMGSFRLGTQNSLFKDVSESFDVAGGPNLGGGSSLYQLMAVTTRPGDAIKYTLPTVSNITANIMYMASGNPSNNAGVKSNANGTAYSAVYSSGNLQVGGSYEKYKDVYRAANFAIYDSFYDVNMSGNTAGLVDHTTRTIGGSYKLGGGVTIKGQQYRVADSASVVAANKVVNNGNHIGVMYQAGANTFTGSITKGKVLRGQVTSDVKTSGYQLIAVHDLSKRTNVYFAYGQTELDDRNSASDAKRTDTAIGLRHSF